MPRRIPDYPDAFSIWNAVSSFGSLISVVATVLFGYIVYDLFANGKEVSNIQQGFKPPQTEQHSCVLRTSTFNSKTLRIVKPRTIGVAARCPTDASIG